MKITKNMKAKTPNKEGWWWRYLDGSKTIDSVYVYNDGRRLCYTICPDCGISSLVKDDSYWQGECIKLNDGDVVLSKEQVEEIKKKVIFISTYYKPISGIEVMNAEEKINKLLEGK